MRKVLVVIDMQNDFITGALGSPQAQAIVSKVADKIRAHVRDGSEIIFTRDTHHRNYLETQEGRHLPVVHCIEGSEGWEVAAELKEAAGAVEPLVFDKGSFGSLALAGYLGRGKVYDEIELVGLVSSICVISNALMIKAHLPETLITVDASCTAGVGEEDYRASLCVMKMCHVNVIHEERPA